MTKRLFLPVIPLLFPMCLSAQVLGDLAYNSRTNLIAHTNNWGADPLGVNGAESIFFSNPCLPQFMNGGSTGPTSTHWATTQPLVRNTNFWLRFAPEITAIPERFGTGGASAYALTGQGGFFAISPRHILTVDHMLGAGNTNDQNLLFIDDQGSVVVRRLIGVVELTNVDLDVGILNADLPSTVHPFSVLPFGYTNYLFELMLPALRGRVQMVVCDQWRAVKPALWQMSADNGLFHLVYFNDDSATWLGTNGNRAHIGGDSGCPVMALVGTNLVCVSAYDAGNTAPDVSFYIPDINAVMHALSTNFNAGSDYQLKIVDLSGYMPNHRPAPPMNFRITGSGP